MREAVNADPIGRPPAASGLVVDHLSVTFRMVRGLRRIEVAAVQDCSFAVPPGGRLALIGESGSGKTTITNAVLGLTPASAGKVAFDGRALCDVAAGRRRAAHDAGIQVVMQDPLSSFNPRYRLLSSMAMPLRVAGSMNDREIAEHLKRLASRVGVTPELLDKYPHQLSGGQLQRLSIARAVSVSPRLIIADEPASKLDVSVRAQVLNLLNDLIAEAASSLLLITHDLDVARFLCDTVAVMHHGKLLEQGALREVFARPKDEYTRTLLDGSGAREVAFA